MTRKNTHPVRVEQNQYERPRSAGTSVTGQVENHRRGKKTSVEVTVNRYGLSPIQKMLMVKDRRVVAQRPPKKWRGKND